MADQQYDVVVAGAGMVGAAFAALLAVSDEGKNLRIAILEARPFQMPDLTEHFDPRVVALTEPSRQLLEDVGVWSQIANRRACAYQRMEVWESDGTGHIEFDCTEVRQPSLGHIVENALIVDSLLQKIETLDNVDLLCPVKLTDLETTKGGVVISLEDGSSKNRFLQDNYGKKNTI